jgi:hypothetical protein
VLASKPLPTPKKDLIKTTSSRDKNEAGIRLWSAASALIGTAYSKPNMSCDKLISMASRAAGIHIVTAPFSKGTVTKSWFDHGLGPEFRQIWGGETGMSLTELAAKETSNRITIPIGSVIVAEGHAALFDGYVKYHQGRQMLLLDANNDVSHTISLKGVPDVPNDKMIELPGHQVGYHATRLQWKEDTRVKVFEPIGY